MLSEVRTGTIVTSDGTVNPARSDKTGSLVVTNGHGRYTEPALRGTIFSGSIAGQVTTVGLATTYTGLCLSNPLGSPVNLVLNKVGYSFIVAFAAGAHLGLMTGYNASSNVTHTAAVTPRCQLFTGLGGGVGLLDSSATLPTAPTLNLVFGSGLTGAITTTPFGLGDTVDLEGSIVLSPGSYCAFYTSTASGAAAGAFSFQWEEVAR